MPEMNRQILLAARPSGYPKPEDFRFVETPVAPVLDGQFLVRALYLSVDPYMRGRMNDGASYARGVNLGEVMTGGVVGEVVATSHDGFREGEVVQGNFGWQAYAVTDGKGVRKVDPSLAPVSTALGVLGMPGLTAYFGLLAVSPPVAGETVLVSAASGAVGSIVGQIAKIKGCRAVGTAGSDVKVRHVLDDLGFDGAFNYRQTGDCGQALEGLCPQGIDVYFDNVGGPITDAVFPHMNVKGRISVCGQISQYNVTEPPVGPRLLWHCITKRLKVEGFLVFDFADRYPAALEQLAVWVRSGRIKYREDVVEGLERAPEAFIGMLRGEHIGKRLVKV